MRVGFKATYGGRPVKGASIVPLLPLTTGFPFFPAQPETDSNGEWFGVVPLAVSPATYLMDVTVRGMGHEVRINGTFDEIESYFLVNLSEGTFTHQRLGHHPELYSCWSRLTSYGNSGSLHQIGNGGEGQNINMGLFGEPGQFIAAEHRAVIANYFAQETSRG